jgi:hypothetical protein
MITRLAKLLKHSYTVEQQLRDLNESPIVNSKKANLIESLENILADIRFEIQILEDVGNRPVAEAVAAFGPGQDSTSPESDSNPPPGSQSASSTTQASSAPTQTNTQQPGQASPTPQSGGATPTPTADGMVKMAKLGPDRKPQGTPIMVKPTDIAIKQKQGFFVIGESKEEKKDDKPKYKMVYCSQCGKGFGPGNQGYSHCKDHKGKRVVEENVNPATDTKNFSIKKVKDHKGVDRYKIFYKDKPAQTDRIYHSREDAERAIKKMTTESASAGASSAGGIAAGGFGNGFANGGPGTVTRYGKKKKKITEISKGTEETQLTDKEIQRRLDRLEMAYRKIANEGEEERKQNRLWVMINDYEKRARETKNDIKRIHYNKMAQQLRDQLKTNDGVEEGTMSDAEKESSGPEFTGYWKGTDKGTPGKKMVGGGS